MLHRKNRRKQNHCRQQNLFYYCEYPQNQATFYKVNKTFTNCYIQPEQQKKMISCIKNQIKRPQTSYTLRKDYQGLMSLVSCTKKMAHSRHKSMATLRKIKGIHNSHTMQNFYEPVRSQIKTSSGQRQRKRHMKNQLTSFQKQKKKSIKKELHIENYLQDILSINNRCLKNLIPPQARLVEKMKIFGQIDNSQREIILTQLKEFMNFQIGNITVQGYQMPLEYQIYLKFMINVGNNSENLKIKEENKQIYEQIKNQMIGHRINEQKISQILENIRLYEGKNEIMTQQMHQNAQKMIQKRKKCKMEDKRYLNQKKSLRNTTQQSVGNQDENNIPRSYKEKELLKQFYHYFDNAYNKVQKAQSTINYFKTQRQNRVVL